MPTDLTLLFAMQHKTVSDEKTYSQHAWGTEWGSVRTRDVPSLSAACRKVSIIAAIDGQRLPLTAIAGEAAIG